MSSIRNFKGYSRLKDILSITIFSLASLQGCGNFDSDHLDSEDVSDVKRVDGSSQPLSRGTLEGTWVRVCVPGQSSLEERLILRDGQFEREYISYKNDCREKEQSYSVKGRYIVGTAATDPKELAFVNGNFALRPSSIKDVHNIDFTIDEWTFDLYRGVGNQERVDLDALKSECPVLRVVEEANVIRIQRNGCKLMRLNTQLFDVIAQSGEQISLGMYVRDLNTFDPAGGTTAELRNNVVNNQPLNRIK